MAKTVVRQVQKNQTRYDVCLAPRIRQALGVEQGDSVSFDVNPDSGSVILRKVGQRNLDVDDDELEESEAGPASETRQRRQANAGTIQACRSCRCPDIEVSGNEYYCPDCEWTFRITPQGNVKPFSRGRSGKLAQQSEEIDDQYDDLDSRLERIEGVIESWEAMQANAEAKARQDHIDAGEDDKDFLLHHPEFDRQNPAAKAKAKAVQDWEDDHPEFDRDTPEAKAEAKARQDWEDNGGDPDDFLQHHPQFDHRTKAQIQAKSRGGKKTTKPRKDPRDGVSYVPGEDD